jgi:hypothetical protein
LVVWEAETGRQYLDLGEHKGAVNDIAWRDDSNVFASASDDGTIKVWDVVAGTAIKTISAHAGGVTAVAFDHQGRMVSAGKDRRVKLWDAAGNLVREFPEMAEQVLTAAITHDGSRVVAGDWNGDVLMVESENPEAKRPLAANPPPAADRLGEQLEKLALIEPEFQKSLAAAGELAAKLGQATAGLQALIAQRDEKIAAAKAADEASVAMVAQANKLNEEIVGLAVATRDMHDLVVAGRLGNLESAEAQQEVADRESALAESLQKVAQMRRDQINVRAGSVAKSDESKRLTGEADAMQSNIATAEAAVVESKAAVDAFAPGHASIVSAKETVERMVAQLRLAVESK